MAERLSLLTPTIYENTRDTEKGGGNYDIIIDANPSGNSTLHNSVRVHGILKESIGWNIRAGWEKAGLENVVDSILSSNPLFKLVDNAIDISTALTGKSFTNTGLFTKKVYKGSTSYLDLSISMRVFDYGNISTPTKVATFLTILCIPKKSNETINLDELLSIPEEESKKRIEEIESTEIGKKIIETAENTLNKIDEHSGIVTNVTDAYNFLKKSSISWADAPDTLDIQIGRWIKITDLVLENVQCEFSFETNKYGPLWADFKLLLSTQEAVALNQDGKIQQITFIGSSINKSRVTIY